MVQYSGYYMFAYVYEKINILLSVFFFVFFFVFFLFFLGWGGGGWVLHFFGPFYDFSPGNKRCPSRASESSAIQLFYKQTCPDFLPIPQ